MILDHFSLSIWLADIAIFGIAFYLGRWWEARSYVNRLDNLLSEVSDLRNIVDELERDLHDYTRP